MKVIVSILFALALTSAQMLAQEVGEYGFLQLPVSSHAAALGGTAVSVVEPEGALADQNPALLCPEMTRQLNLSYMNYVESVNLGYASYTGAYREKGAWQVGMRFVHYGEFQGYDETGASTGTFSAQDLALHFGLGYPINERWRIGGSMRTIYSKYESYSAFALGVEVGLNYYNEGSGRSFSAVVSNLGGQLKKLEGRTAHLPTQLSLGVTKEVEHLPFCFTLTATDLFDWDQNFVNGDGTEHKWSGMELLLNHILWGAEWVPTENFYVAAAYSLRRQREFAGDGGFLRGISLGAGLHTKTLQVQVSYASYNAASGSLMVGLGVKF